MNTAGKAILAAGVAGAAAMARRRARGSAAAGEEASDRWLTVTVYRAPEEVQPLPDELARWREEIEIRVQPAAGDKGTELMVRPIGEVSRHELRLALRRAKSVLEAGEVVKPDTAPTHPGPMGKALRLVTNRAGGGGRL
ncbi:hypothetical protein SAMN05216188_126116 [Lentzea xinjiangensis]|uniref:Uncharacterized protein n=1 Tax=Lentzea xinjiangensis TaxID=402600 RepID=A0A1H9VJX0_9PSEU|nr:hypothetical protein [Lentzea xinjiangensis]SES21892.1 hypothetical protein SAMN05216188_126116 [Lentzea xinjiangensis]